MAKAEIVHDHMHGVAAVDHFGFEDVLTLGQLPSGSIDGQKSIQGMLLDQGTTHRLPSHVALAYRLDELEAITDRDKNLLIYFWKPSLNLMPQLRSLSFKELPECDVTVSAKDYATQIPSDCPTLATDILNELAPCLEALVSFSGANRLRISFGKTHEQMCPLFHVDRMRLRLICTLRGPGTEWLDNRDVKRGALGKGDSRQVVASSAIIYQLGLWQIGFLKGEKFPGAHKRGIVHRSPALAHGAEGRSYLRIDGLL